MAKSKRDLLIEKIEEFIKDGILIGEVPDKKTQELAGLVAEAEKQIESKDELKPIVIEEYFKTPEDEKQWYLKAEYFGQKQFGVQKNGDGSPPTQVVVEVNYRELVFGNNNKQRFVKDVALTPEQLRLFNDFQKEKYLEFR